MIVLLPAAGAAKRFFDAGYTIPKPLIEVDKGFIMIQKVVESLKDLQFFDAKLIILMQREHLETSYSTSEIVGTGRGIVEYYLKKAGWKNYYQLVEVEGLTGGAVDTTLLATKYLMTGEELLICNSDQYVEIDMINFINYCRNFDGCLMTFENNDPKWSYIDVNEYNGEILVDKVAEKIVLPGNHSNIGIYYYSNSLVYLQAAHSMLDKGIKTNSETYVAPIYNEILRTCRISHYKIDNENFYPMGTPLDLDQTKKRKNWT